MNKQSNMLKMIPVTFKHVANIKPLAEVCGNQINQITTISKMMSRAKIYFVCVTFAMWVILF